MAADTPTLHYKAVPIIASNTTLSGNLWKLNNNSRFHVRLEDFKPAYKCKKHDIHRDKQSDHIISKEQ
jgi:hypothetical protein